MPHKVPHVIGFAEARPRAASFFDDPLKVGAMLGLTMLIFRQRGREHALAPGLRVAQRNMGLLRATTWLYFALSQFPIYITPQLLRPIARTKAA